MPAQRFSIVVVGDGAVGKSAMTLRFLRDHRFHDEYDPTIEDSYCKHVEVDGQEYTLDITDTAGQEEYRGHWNDKFMRNQIWRAKESEHVPIVIAANKSDLEQEREVSVEAGQEFAQLSNAYYIETSAKTGHHIHEMMIELVREIVRTREREGYADMPDQELKKEEWQQQQPQPTKGYMKSPTPAGPLPSEEDEEAEESRFCCCSIM
ncbi:hypothetical protein BGZ83_003622 [Gryganskiella cystojenkinii]|nr:hypothetical protein BGZ83_003622 [Gryganskiella cystojenkinii]